MLDTIVLHIPFLDRFVISGGKMSYLVPADLPDSVKKGTRDLVPLESGLHLADASTIYACTDSIKTKYASIHFSIKHKMPTTTPYTQLKVSAAKLAQGHNVYHDEPSYSSIATASSEMLNALKNHHAELYDMLDISKTKISSIDVAYNAYISDELLRYKVIQELSRLNTASISARLHEQTTVYFRTGTDLKAYLKREEVQHCIDSKRKKLSGESLKAHKEALKDKRCIEAVRFECTLNRKTLKKMCGSNYLLSVIDYAAEHKTMFRDAHKTMFRDVFKAVDGVKMTDSVINVFNQLKDVYSQTVADRLFGVYCKIYTTNYKTIESITSPKTFYRAVKELNAAGISKAHLQNIGFNTRQINLEQLLSLDYE